MRIGIGWLVLIALMAGLARAGEPTTRAASPDARYAVGEVLFADDFDQPIAGRWESELEKGGRVEAKGGALEIDVPGGATVWWRQPVEGAVMFEYDVTQVKAGGANDRVSDTNLFWMAHDTRSLGDIFATKRTGKFAEYNRLLCYYAGIGGNGNTTTRFRRYVGDETVRPLLPEHDLRDAASLLEANRAYHIRAVACGRLIQVWRDDRKLFEMNDDQPYTSGWFGFRTVTSHQVVKRFRVYRLTATATGATTQPAAVK